MCQLVVVGTVVGESDEDVWDMVVVVDGEGEDEDDDNHNNRVVDNSKDDREDEVPPGEVGFLMLLELVVRRVLVQVVVSLLVGMFVSGPDVAAQVLLSVAAAAVTLTIPSLSL
jgi:hypothetical protein